MGGRGQLLGVEDPAVGYIQRDVAAARDDRPDLEVAAELGDGDVANPADVHDPALHAAIGRGCSVRGEDQPLIRRRARRLLERDITCRR